MVNEPQENYKTGYISIYRSLRKHWLWTKNKPLTELEAWICILFEVNHKPEKVRFGYNIIDCDRGESLNSLDTWAKLFNWNKSRVRRFMNLLKNDSMIELKSEHITTHLKVCNYDSYQNNRHADETQVKRKRNANETQVTPNNNDNNENNILTIQKDFEKEVLSFEKEYSFEMLKDFFRYWSEPTKDKKKMLKDLQKTWDTKRRLITWEKNQKKFNR